MSTAELKTALIKELDKLGKNELKEAYALLMSWLKQPKTQTTPKQREIGSLKGILQYMSEDFDAPLEDFKEYM